MPGIDLYSNEAIAAFHVDSEKVDAHWLYYELPRAASRGATDTAIKGVTLNKAKLVGLCLEVPPLPEQRQIAAILDTIDDAIQKTEQIIAKLKQVKQGLLHDLLTRGIDDNGELRDPERHPEQFKDSPLGRIPRYWEVRPIDQMLARVIDYRGRTPIKTGSGIPLLTAKNVRDGYVDSEPREYIAVEAYDRWMTRGIPSPGDVLFTTEAPLGNAAAVPPGQVALAQRVITLVPAAELLDQSFLLSMLLLPQTKRRLVRYSTGSTVLGVKQSVFRKIPFAFPRIAEQRVIGQTLKALQARLEREEYESTKLNLLKTGLQEDLLTGRVRVTSLLESAAE
jgi:type I restriction enzyme, S subunit